MASNFAEFVIYGVCVYGFDLLSCHFHMCTWVELPVLPFYFDIWLQVPIAFCWSVLVVAMAALIDVEE